MVARRPWFSGAILLVLAACGGDDAAGPPEIQYGLEECAYCRMIISEQKFAAALVDQAETATSFDDVGCLLEYQRENPGEGRERWVHDHSGGGWIAVEQAWFVRGPPGSTPMGSGLSAFATREAAEAAAEDPSAVFDWSALAEL